MAYNILGVDVSLNSTGFCYRQENVIKYGCVHNLQQYVKKNEEYVDLYNRISQTDLFVLLKEADIHLEFFQREPTPKVKSIGLSEWERIHLQNSYTISNLISGHINKLAKDQNNKLIFENYSHGAGDQLIQIVEFTSKLKYDLVFNHKIANIENFFLIPGPTLKSFAHKKHNKKFSADKISMVEIWLSEVDPSDKLKKTVLENRHIFIKNIKKKNGTVIEAPISPLDDLVDAYFLTEYLKDKYKK